MAALCGLLPGGYVFEHSASPPPAGSRHSGADLRFLCVPVCCCSGACSSRTFTGVRPAARVSWRCCRIDSALGAPRVPSFLSPVADHSGGSGAVWLLVHRAVVSAAVFAGLPMLLGAWCRFLRTRGASTRERLVGTGVLVALIAGCVAAWSVLRPEPGGERAVDLHMSEGEGGHQFPVPGPGEREPAGR